MRIQTTRQLRTWLAGVKERPDQLEYRLAMTLLKELMELEEKPGLESATFKRVRQARRYEVWRVSHTYYPEYAVRVLCWFPVDGTAVVALVGGEKAGMSDVWYDSATIRAEAAIDQWIREHERDA